MSDSNGHGPVLPEGAIRGRFALVPSEGGGAMLYWVTDLCDDCLAHGCGHQKEPLDLTPGGAMKTFLKLRGWQKAGAIGD